jgi:mRNA interferase MazF
MAQIRRGEIWLVNFDPSQGYEIRKTRPAVIIQNDFGNKHSEITIVAAITSNIERIFPNEVLIEDSGLRTPSKIMLSQIRPIDKILLKHKIGELKPEEVHEMDEALKISLGLKNP